MPPSRSHLTAAQAAQALGVTRPTLYAYVSRGQLRSEPVPSRPKERRYHREDVERLQQLKAARRDPQAAAVRSLHGAAPVLESRITLIDGGRCYFRGRDAVTLAGTASVEETAALLWEASAAEGASLFRQPCVLPPAALARVRRSSVDPLGQMQMALAIAGSMDMAAADLRGDGVRHAGARIVQLLTSVVAGRHPGRRPVHEVLRDAWAPQSRPVADVIRTALVLCADHELNVSAFTARCAASAGASPYDVVSAALAALKGHRHGAASSRALALLRRADSPAAARAAIADRLRHGEPVPGFGHPLYPDGDPRAAALLRLAYASKHGDAVRSIRSTARAAAALLHEEPNLDFGLAAIAVAFALPPYAPPVLFALGRTLGWIAHAMEQYASGQLIRPRARYVGPPPLAR